MIIFSSLTPKLLKASVLLYMSCLFFYTPPSFGSSTADTLTQQNISFSKDYSALLILLEQCLQYQLSSTDFYLTWDNTKQTLSNPESPLIPLFNIRDQLNYFKQLPSVKPLKERVIQCQLHLSEHFNIALESYNKNAGIIENAITQQPKNRQLQQWYKQVKLLQQKSIPKQQKAIVHTAQATIKKRLREQQTVLEFVNQDCQLTNIQGSTYNKNSGLNITVVRYLLHQTDHYCQQQVWQTFQERAANQNREALTEILRIYTKIAQQNGYIDHTSYLLNFQFLNSAKLVKQFLDGQTNNLNFAPWQIGQQLKDAPKTNILHLTSAKLLTELISSTEKLGYRFEMVTDTIIRVWHGRRLLGEILLNNQSQINNISAHQLRSPILGSQYGQVMLVTPLNITHYRQLKSVINVFSQALASLSQSGGYYLINNLYHYPDLKQLPQRWLALYLNKHHLPATGNTSQESLEQRYREQLTLFRAKVALNYYQAKNHKSYPDLATEFVKAFHTNWPTQKNYPMTFYQISTLGPLYYQDIWQQKLAHHIFQLSQCKDMAKVATQLLINEDRLEFIEIFERLFEKTFDIETLLDDLETNSKEKMNTKYRETNC